MAFVRMLEHQGYTSNVAHHKHCARHTPQAVHHEQAGVRQ
jgi:hypothetical protein